MVPGVAGPRYEILAKMLSMDLKRFSQLFVDAERMRSVSGNVDHVDLQIDFIITTQCQSDSLYFA